MRRPHVYERSAPRRRREDGAIPGVDPAEAARHVARALPVLMALARSAGLSALADLLDAAWTEAAKVEAERVEAERVEDEAGRA